MKVQEVISNVSITVENENHVGQIIQLGIPGTQGAFLDNVTPDIDGFTDGPFVRCDVRVVKNTFIDDFN